MNVTLTEARAATYRYPTSKKEELSAGIPYDTVSGNEAYLAHELVKCNVLRVSPPHLPIISVVGGDGRVSYRRIKLDETKREGQGRPRAKLLESKLTQTYMTLFSHFSPNSLGSLTPHSRSLVIPRLCNPPFNHPSVKAFPFEDQVPVELDFLTNSSI